MNYHYSTGRAMAWPDPPEAVTVVADKVDGTTYVVTEIDDIVYTCCGMCQREHVAAMLNYDVANAPSDGDDIVFTFHGGDRAAIAVWFGPTYDTPPAGTTCVTCGDAL